MNFTEIAIIGGGPAGLCAATIAAQAGANVTVFDRNKKLGGQLIKQTHRFFGSEKEFAGTRGIDIADQLIKATQQPRITVKTDTTVLGVYEDGVITYLQGNHYDKLVAEKIIVATGALERQILFEKNDLPGIYGAGAVQTMMNLYGVLPGKRFLMVGAGNIGLIVSYQLLQAGAEIAAVIDVAPSIGGYQVHASKLRRNGVPIYVKTGIKAALGTEEVEGAVIADVDDKYQLVEGTERELKVDTICLAAGLNPLNELLVNVGCKLKFVPQLGGMVPVRNENLETTAKGVFVAGDVSSIEEASAAMLEGTIAGASAVLDMGFSHNDLFERRQEAKRELEQLRAGSTGNKIRSGIKLVMED